MIKKHLLQIYSLFDIINSNTKIRRQRRVVNSYLLQRAKEWWDFSKIDLMNGLCRSWWKSKESILCRKPTVI